MRESVQEINYMSETQQNLLLQWSHKLCSPDFQQSVWGLQSSEPPQEQATDKQKRQKKRVKFNVIKYINIVFFPPNNITSCTFYSEVVR